MSLVFPPHVSLYGLFPVLVWCDYWLILVQPCLSNYLWFTCVFIVLSVQLNLVWSTCYPRYFLSVSLALSCLVIIKDYYLSLILVCVFLVSPCCVHRDRRPDLTVSGAHSLRFVFHFWKSCCFVPVCLFCLSRGKEVAACHPALACVKSAWEFGGIAASPLAASPHARRSREISAAGCGYPKPAGWSPSSRIAADSSPPDCRWLKPAGLWLFQARRIALTQARPPLTLAPWIQSTCSGQECRVYVLLCPQEHFN